MQNKVLLLLLLPILDAAAAVNVFMLISDGPQKKSLQSSTRTWCAVKILPPSQIDTVADVGAEIVVSFDVEEEVRF